eukprot:4676854-Amphidinium_carterae.1
MLTHTEFRWESEDCLLQRRVVIPVVESQPRDNSLKWLRLRAVLHAWPYGWIATISFLRRCITTQSGFRLATASAFSKQRYMLGIAEGRLLEEWQ